MEHYKSDIEDQEYQIKIYQRFNLKPNRENVGLVSKSRNIVEQTEQLNSGSPSFYDACYHSIALLNNCDFITADKKHYEKTKALGNIRLLQDVA